MISWPAPPGGLSTEASWFRKLLMACRQTEILPSAGYRVKETSNGRILDILKQPVPSFAQVPPFVNPASVGTVELTTAATCAPFESKVVTAVPSGGNGLGL